MKKIAINVAKCLIFHLHGLIDKIIAHNHLAAGKPRAVADQVHCDVVENFNWNKNHILEIKILSSIDVESWI